MELSIYKELQEMAAHARVPVAKLVNDVLKYSLLQDSSTQSGDASASSMEAAKKYFSLNPEARQRWFEKELLKINPPEQKAAAEEGMAEDMKSWPPY